MPKPIDISSGPLALADGGAAPAGGGALIGGWAAADAPTLHAINARTAAGGRSERRMVAVRGPAALDTMHLEKRPVSAAGGEARRWQRPRECWLL